MVFAVYWKAILVFAPIVGLLALGLLIALPSGVTTLGSAQARARVAENISSLILRLAACALALSAFNRMAGSPIGISW